MKSRTATPNPKHAPKPSPDAPIALVPTDLARPAPEKPTAEELFTLTSLRSDNLTGDLVMEIGAILGTVRGVLLGLAKEVNEPGIPQAAETLLVVAENKLDVLEKLHDRQALGLCRMLGHAVSPRRVA